jgi:enamine deaminase RidA (YjgF/YER057c/UK114 family)
MFAPPEHIHRWPGSAPGRSRAVAVSGLAWIVANARKTSGGTFSEQVIETFAALDECLRDVDSGRDRLISVQVFLASIDDRNAFDREWCRWIGNLPSAWPQRAVVEAKLAPGLLLELVVVAKVLDRTAALRTQIVDSPK